MYQPTELVLEVHKNPPRCLASFNASAIMSAPGIENLFNELALFRIECKCGSGKFRIVGYPNPDAGLLSPHQLECLSCRVVRTLFDIREHGYDAEFKHGCYSMVGSGESSIHTCSCGGDVFEVIVAVSYQLEPEDLGEEEVAHIQDFFDGYSLEAHCAFCELASPCRPTSVRKYAAHTPNYAFKPIAELALRSNQTIVPQRLNAALDPMEGLRA